MNETRTSTRFVYLITARGFFSKWLRKYALLNRMDLMNLMGILVLLLILYLQRNHPSSNTVKVIGKIESIDKYFEPNSYDRFLLYLVFIFILLLLPVVLCTVYNRRLLVSNSPYRLGRFFQTKDLSQTVQKSFIEDIEKKYSHIIDKWTFHFNEKIKNLIQKKSQLDKSITSIECSKTFEKNKFKRNFRIQSKTLNKVKSHVNSSSNYNALSGKQSRIVLNKKIKGKNRTNDKKIKSILALGHNKSKVKSIR